MKCSKDVKGGVYIYAQDHLRFLLFTGIPKKGEKPELQFKRRANHLRRYIEAVRVPNEEFQALVECFAVDERVERGCWPWVNVRRVFAAIRRGKRKHCRDREVAHGMHHEF